MEVIYLQVKGEGGGAGGNNFCINKKVRGAGGKLMFQPTLRSYARALLFFNLACVSSGRSDVKVRYTDVVSNLRPTVWPDRGVAARKSPEVFSASKDIGRLLVSAIRFTKSPGSRRR